MISIHSVVRYCLFWRAAPFQVLKERSSLPDLQLESRLARIVSGTFFMQSMYSILSYLAPPDFYCPPNEMGNFAVVLLLDDSSILCRYSSDP